MDASIHAQCFNSMARSAEGWCANCHSFDHISGSCPWRPPIKRPAPSTLTGPPAKRGAPMTSAGAIICIKFNRASKCRGAHPYQHATSLENRQEGRGPTSKTETELPHINRGGVLSTIFTLIMYAYKSVAHTMCAIAVVFYGRKKIIIIIINFFFFLLQGLH